MVSFDEKYKIKKFYRSDDGKQAEIRFDYDPDQVMKRLNTSYLLKFFWKLEPQSITV